MLYAYIWENTFGWSILTYSKAGLYSFTFGHKNKTDALTALNQQLIKNAGHKYVGVIHELPLPNSLLTNYEKQNINKKDWLNKIISDLNLYFEGKKVRFNCPLDLSWCTKFQKTVLLETFKIPYGRILTYSQIAQKIKHPTAYRAVGNALGNNKIPIIIPCHRVIRLNGSLGGFTGGLAIKQKLLNLEKD